MSAALQAEAASLDWTPVQSSNVAEIAYNPTFSRLFVKFNDGRRYAYDRVPEAVYWAFLEAASKGQFLYKKIRANGTDSLYGYHGPF